MAAAGKPSYDDLAKLVDQLREEVAQLRRQLEEERRGAQQQIGQLEEELRVANRQVGRFRRRETLIKPESEKKKPGRKEGHPGTHRPRPTVIDQHLEVPLAGCPKCHGELSDVQKREQFIEEIPPVKPRVIHLTTWTGRCAKCGCVQSTHPLQTSTAVGAAGTHLGPRAQALAVLLSHRTALTMGKTCELLYDLCGLKLSRGGLAQLLQRAGDRLNDFYREIFQRIRDSAAVFADETSWYVGEPSWWLWIFTTPQATLYHIDKRRNSDVVQRVLGDYAGMLVSDCLASYDRIDCRKHKCIAHHLRAVSEQESKLTQRGLKSSYLLQWKLFFRLVIDTWNQRDTLPAAAFAAKVVAIETGLDHLLSRAPPEPEEQTIKNRLAKQRAHLLGCLAEPLAEPTNNRAERDLRPAVIGRKLSCGNKTPAGKIAWEKLRSVVTTLSKRGDDILATLVPYLRLAGQ